MARLGGSFSFEAVVSDRYETIEMCVSPVFIVASHARSRRAGWRIGAAPMQAIGPAVDLA
jgi:hypothetical protein